MSFPLPPPDALDVVDYIAQTRDTYSSLGYGEYRWAENPETPPLTDAPTDLSDARVALIASGGIYLAGQVAFTHKDDVSFREIPTDTPLGDLRISHFAYDQTDARHDPNVVFPLGTLRRLVAEGAIGGLTSHALTFMGGIYSQRRLRENLIPRFVQRIQDMAADVVLLVPV